ncbi:MAG: hypothetical protein H0T61_08725 [Actinobacteria bacterium]|nr:hypothetical protein [Actinomycetota bacterium]
MARRRIGDERPRALAAAVVARRRIVLREAGPADEVSLSRLAQLADRRLPPSPLLVAEVDGELLAARGADGLHIADPFSATCDLIDLLDLRAEQLHAAAA